jgi:hypothetical protein
MTNNFVLIVFFTLIFAACANKPVIKNQSFAMVEPIKIEHNYKSLKLLDLDQMTDLLYEKADDYKKNNRVQALREGVMIAFSRSNEDVILDKVISIVKSPLEDIGEWESTVEQMVGQSIQAINDKNAPAADQVTASVILENILSEFKPAFTKQYQSGGFETSVIERIAGSEMRYSKKAEQERKLNQMKSGLTPAQLAQKLVEIKNKKIEEEKKKK